MEIFFSHTQTNVYTNAVERRKFILDSVVKIPDATCIVKPQLLADSCPGCACCPYSTAPVVPPRLRPPAWAAGPTACLPTPGQSVTYDLCHYATPPHSAAPTSSPLRPQCCLRSTAHLTLPCIGPARIGWRKPRLSR